MSLSANYTDQLEQHINMRYEVITENLSETLFADFDAPIAIQEFSSV